MIYLDSCALLKFVKPEKESPILVTWRQSLDEGARLCTSALARLEIGRALGRQDIEPIAVPYYTARALKGVYIIELSSNILARATAYPARRLGSLDALHLATAEPLRGELEGFVTYDKELTLAADELGLPVLAPA